MDSPFTSSSFLFADNASMPPPQYNTDQNLQPGASNFPLPIRSSSPVTAASERGSPSLTNLNTDHGFDFPSPSFLASSNPRKRRHESMNRPSLSAESIAKSRRTTPSPALTGNTTPASFASFDFSQDPYLVQLLGGNPRDHMAEMVEEQKAQERELQARREQERLDAEFARQLAETPQDGQPIIRPSDLPQRTSQSFLDSNGKIRRPDPPVIAPIPPPQPPFTFAAPFNQNPTSPFKAPMLETPQAHPTPLQSFDNFIDLGSDDDEPLPSSEPIINASNNQFTSSADPRWISNSTISTISGVPDAANTGTSFSATSDTNGSSFDTLGGSNVYDQPWNSGFDLDNTMNWANEMGSFGQNVVGMAKGAWTSAYNNLDQQIASYPTIGNGYGQSATQTSSEPAVIDLDSYDEPQSSMTGYPYQNPAMRSSSWDDDLRDRYMERVNYLTNDPTRTTTEIKDLLENIRPDEELPIENREGTPEAMVYPLMEHQKLGLAWMKAMEEGSNKGGILADDMGLGKTIQALALMVARRSLDPNRKTTLIVAPLALMKQWEREIKSKLKGGREHRLNTYTLHGQGRGASWEELKLHDVVLTTFGTLSTEIKRKEPIDEAKRKNPNWKPVTKADRLPLLGDECKWYRVILDEAQCIKNKNTKAAQGACALQSLTRFCMSGTPMQNGVTELYSLVHFLRIRPYNDFYRFNMDFTRPLKSSYDPEKARGMQKLQALLKAILLRRNKKSTIDGKPILTLPERTTESRHAEFSEDEQAFYSALETQTQLNSTSILERAP